MALSEQQLQDLVKAIEDYRASKGGLLSSIDELSQVKGVTPPIIAALKQECSLGPFTILSAEMVGPKVGRDLRRQAIQATLYALAAMLVYIAFRFEWIYGVAAVVAVFHDTIITIGLFSLFNKEISLTVVAALLYVGRLLDERHHRGVRSHSRKSQAVAAGVAPESDQYQRESDLEPDHSHQRPDAVDRAVAVVVRRPGAERVFVRVGDWNFDRNVFFGVCGESNSGILAELPRIEEAFRPGR